MELTLLRLVGVGLMLLMTNLLAAQVVRATHEISRWSGAAYRPDDRTRMIGWNDAALNGTFVAEVMLDSAHVPEQNSHELFGPTLLQYVYGMQLYSTITIKQEGCYELSLNSDDGSRLWLDEQQVLDNDGKHKMRLRKTQLVLEQRAYPARLWYYNGYADAAGLILDIKRLGDRSLCESSKAPPPPEPLVLEGSALFDTGESALSERATSVISALCEQLAAARFTRITISGHTDNVGRSGSNLLLSKRRAGSVLTQLRQCLDLSQVSIEVQGFGDYQPVASNDTESGRAQNRRVEILVE